MIDFRIRPFAIRGWEDRGCGPHYAEVRIVAYETGDGMKFVQDWATLPRMVAQVQMLDHQHRFIQLVADTRPIAEA
jgi:hypothetical protein